MAAYVQRLPNSIGYVEYACAKQNRLAYALLQNAAGSFVAPDDDSFKGRRVPTGRRPSSRSSPSNRAWTPGRSPARPTS